MITVSLEKNDGIKAIGLLSGGLDSSLAVRLMLDQNVDITVLNFVTPFCTCTRKGCKHEARRVAKLLNVPIKIITCGQGYVDMVKNPKYGYGKNINPCIDCRIFMFKKAKEYMNEIGASFIFTGEVLGQRPMSQHRRALAIIEKESGLTGFIVRPLSAKLFPPTIPEMKQWINRNEMLSIQGRRRIIQMEFANELGVNDYPCPAGGCRLTDPHFAQRLRESFEHDEIRLTDIQLLRYGRHFRLVSGAKVAVGRNEEENRILKTLIDTDDIALEALNIGSPLVLLRKQKGRNDIKEAALLCLRYSDAGEKDNPDIKIQFYNGQETIGKLSSF